MRTYALALAAAALFALPTSAFSQGIEFGPGGVRIEPGYHSYYHRYYIGNCGKRADACGRQGRGDHGSKNAIAKDRAH